MTTYTWAVTALYTETIDGKEDYVVIANYEVVGTDGTYNLRNSRVKQRLCLGIAPKNTLLILLINHLTLFHQIQHLVGCLILPKQ